LDHTLEIIYEAVRISFYLSLAALFFEILARIYEERKAKGGSGSKRRSRQ